MEDAKAKCPTCGSTFPAGATFCPECGYVVPVTSPAAYPPGPMTAPPTPQPSVVLVQAPAAAPRESNWGAWVVVAAILLLAGSGFALYNGGYLGGGNPSTSPASSVNIDNSPQMSSQQPAAPAEPVVVTIPASNPPPPATPPPAAPASKTPAIDIVSVKGQALETNSVEWKYGYTLRVRNNTAADVKTNFHIQFLDDQGFPVDDDLMNNLVIPANAELSFDGVDMIKTALAEKIRMLRAEVR